jgi:hypothetical protein
MYPICEYPLLWSIQPHSVTLPYPFPSTVFSEFQISYTQYYMESNLIQISWFTIAKVKWKKFKVT